MALPESRIPPVSRRILSVSDAYSQWAATYDSDDNPLQALDDIALLTLLPDLLGLLSHSRKSDHAELEERAGAGPADAESPLVVDLGCGTGRNTLKLRSSLPHATIVGMDVSPEMLEIARRRCGGAVQSNRRPVSPRPHVAEAAAAAGKLLFRVFDLMACGEGLQDPDASASPKLGGRLAESPDQNGDDELLALDVPWGAADAVLSSLVMEHVPLDKFFASCARLLKVGGLLLATNMHPDMGQTARAGFASASGEKIRVYGFAHGVEEVETEAQNAGFELVVGQRREPAEERAIKVREMAVEEGMVEEEQGLRARGRKWIGIKCWMGGIWRIVERRTATGSTEDGDDEQKASRALPEAN